MVLRNVSKVCKDNAATPLPHHNTQSQPKRLGLNLHLRVESRPSYLSYVTGFSVLTFQIYCFFCPGITPLHEPLISNIGTFLYGSMTTSVPVLLLLHSCDKHAKKSLFPEMLYRH
jgi:RsiW-degrading membrane proteinase PrsW (M82 family)